MLHKLAACLLFAVAASAGCLTTEETEPTDDGLCKLTDSCEDQPPPSEEEESDLCELTDACKDS